MDNVLPRRRLDGVLAQKLDDGIVVFDAKSNEAHALNQTAALVYESCDGETPRSVVLQKICDTLEIPEQEAGDLLAHSLRSFHDKGLLREDASLEAKLTRREFVGRSALLPAILTLSVGNPAAAQSGDPCVGCDCTAAQAGGTSAGADCLLGVLNTEVACGRFVVGVATCTCEPDALTCTTAPINGVVCTTCPP